MLLRVAFWIVKLLIACLFQVAFWIVKTDTPSRTSLGIITILSVTKIGFGGKTKPKVVMVNFIRMRKWVMKSMMAVVMRRG